MKWGDGDSRQSLAIKELPKGGRELPQVLQDGTHEKPITKLNTLIGFHCCH